MKITIITVCYNSAATLEKTILSVANQSYSNIEYIIVDGNSNDGTVDCIKKHEDKITNWISEPDKGLYDAMNKGIAMATGDIIGILNSDDTFYSDKILSEIIWATLLQLEGVVVKAKAVISFAAAKSHSLNSTFNFSSFINADANPPADKDGK